jgi:hypothetical protein
MCFKNYTSALRNRLASSISPVEYSKKMVKLKQLLKHSENYESK